MASMSKEWKTAKEHSEPMWKRPHPGQAYPVKFDLGLSGKLDELEKAERDAKRKGVKYKAVAAVGNVLGKTRTYKSLVEAERQGVKDPRLASLSRPHLEKFGAYATRVGDSDVDRVEALEKRMQELAEEILVILGKYKSRVFPYEDNLDARKAWSVQSNACVTVTVAIKHLWAEVTQFVTGDKFSGGKDAAIHAKASILTETDIPEMYRI